MVTTVYLVRHAEAMGNINETFQGHTDCELSPKGEKQLECLKERFRDTKFDAVYSSPLARAMRTAEAVNFYHGLPIQAERGLIEINGGVFEGKPWKELPIMFPEAYDLWENHHHMFKVEEGESMAEVYNRIRLAIDRIVLKNQGKTVVIVSHGCAIKNFLCFANSIPHEKINTLPWADNTAVSMLEFDSELKPSVIFQNDASHLADGLSTLSYQTWWRKPLSK